MSAPLDRNYRMPAEWEPMAATWLAWPHNRSDWPGRFAAIPFVYAEIVRHLARVGRVEIIVNDEQAEANARTILEFVHVVEPGAYKLAFQRLGKVSQLATR